MQAIKNCQSKEEQLYLLKEFANLEQKRNRTYLTKMEKSKADAEKCIKHKEEALAIKTNKPARQPILPQKNDVEKQFQEFA